MSTSIYRRDQGENGEDASFFSPQNSDDFTSRCLARDAPTGMSPVIFTHTIGSIFTDARLMCVKLLLITIIYCKAAWLRLTLSTVHLLGAALNSFMYLIL